MENPNWQYVKFERTDRPRRISVCYTLRFRKSLYHIVDMKCIESICVCLVSNFRFEYFVIWRKEIEIAKERGNNFTYREDLFGLSILHAAPTKEFDSSFFRIKKIQWICSWLRDLYNNIFSQLNLMQFKIHHSKHISFLVFFFSSKKINV